MTSLARILLRLLHMIEKVELTCLAEYGITKSLILSFNSIHRLWAQ
jgi:hypothetical protein